LQAPSIVFRVATKTDAVTPPKPSGRTEIGQKDGKNSQLNQYAYFEIEGSKNLNAQIIHYRPGSMNKDISSAAK
jgi:hypothetical protein